MTTPTREHVVQCDDVREAFERRFREPPFEFSLELYGEQDAWPGSYKKYSEQCAWDGYQEARADLEAELEGVVDDAMDIFNNKPAETSQEVRDVIEWFKSSLVAVSTHVKVGPT